LKAIKRLTSIPPMKKKGEELELLKVDTGNWSIPYTSGGPYVVIHSDKIVGNTGGATAYVSEIVTESGSWATGTAAGYFLCHSIVGSFESENLNVGANLNVATTTGIITPPEELTDFINRLMVWLPEKYKAEPNVVDYVEAVFNLFAEINNNIGNFAKLYSPTDLEEGSEFERLESLFNLISNPSALRNERVYGLLHASDFIKIKGLLQSVNYYMYKRRLSNQDFTVDIRYLWTGPVGETGDYTTFIPEDIGKIRREAGLAYYPSPHFDMSVHPIPGGPPVELSNADKQELRILINRVRPIETVYGEAYVEKIGILPSIIVLPTTAHSTVLASCIVLSCSPVGIRPVILLLTKGTSLIITDNITLLCG